MRVEKMERVRRRLLKEAIADNVATIRGLPPRALRAPRRSWQKLLRRAPLLLIPITLAASTYFVAQPRTTQATPVTAVISQPPTFEAPVRTPGLRTGQAPALQSSPSLPSEALTEQVFPMQRVKAAAFPLAVRRVVLDAGHGGKDAGATAVAVQEKDITLDIGERLRRLLETGGFEVVITRDTDSTIPLRERARLANESRGDIFVSIHVNAIVKYTASYGVETYYLGPTNDPSLTKLAAEENTVSGYSLADLRRLLDGVYADARREESAELAHAVQKHLYGRLSSHELGLENWGVKRAPFLVLVATDMPAILAEVGCLSNRKEAAMLARPDYRQKIAEALFDGIHAYASANDAPQKKGT